MSVLAFSLLRVNDSHMHGALQTARRIAICYEKRSSAKGSPSLIAGFLSGTGFVEALGLLLKSVSDPVQSRAFVQLDGELVVSGN